MKTLVAILGLTGLLFAGSLFAADVKQDLIAQCTKDANVAGLQGQAAEDFINACLDEKVGYEKDKD